MVNANFWDIDCLHTCRLRETYRSPSLSHIRKNNGLVFHSLRAQNSVKTPTIYNLMVKVYKLMFLNKYSCPSLTIDFCTSELLRASGFASSVHGSYDDDDESSGPG